MTEPALVMARRERYRPILERLGAGAAILASGPGVQHATGVRIYSQAIIPERPVAAILGSERTVLALWEWDQPQIEDEHPGLETATFPEFGPNPWKTIASVAQAVAGPNGRIVVDETCPASAVRPLEAAGLDVVVDVGFDGLMAARTIKDPDEIALLMSAARGLDRAIAGVAALPLGGLSERAIGDAMAARFRAEVDGEVEAAGIVVGPAHLRSTHHLVADDLLTPGPMRLGLKATVDGYWALLTRMGFAGEGAVATGFAADYDAYVDAHSAGWRAMRAGIAAGDIYDLVRERLTRNGLRLRSPKVGHGTGLSFREPPVLRADDPTPLPAGSVYAFDYAVYQDSTRSGAFVHVEDRILLTDDGPVRISDVTDTSKPYDIDLRTRS